MTEVDPLWDIHIYRYTVWSEMSRTPSDTFVEIQMFECQICYCLVDEWSKGKHQAWHRKGNPDHLDDAVAELKGQLVTAKHVMDKAREMSSE